MSVINKEPSKTVDQPARNNVPELDGRVALACSGIGHVNRGYEASVSELFDAVSTRIDAQLYRGKGKSPGKRCLTTIGRRSAIYRVWPLSRISSYSRYRNENHSFAMHLIASLIARPVDIVFTPDHCLALLLRRICKILPRKPEVVFSNGAPFENAFCNRFDAVHQKSFEHYARSQGTPLEAKSWLIPNGFEAERLRQPDSFSRTEVLAGLNVDPTTTVVLALAAHNIAHKRVGWLLSEFARLDQHQFTLVVAGQPTSDSDELRSLSRRLNCNAKFVTVPHQEVPGLIWSSDIMTLCSLSEGFPRAVAESMGGGKHIFVHPHDNAKWIVGDNEYCFVDMEQESALADALRQSADQPDRVASSATKNHQRFLENFTWQKVADAYINMFREILERRRSGISS